MAESRTSDTCRAREHLVWLVKAVASMISSLHEAPILPSCIDARHGYGYPDFRQLLNAGNANFRPPRSLPESLAQRSGARHPGTDSHRDVTNRRMAGVGFARPKNRGQHGRRHDGDLGLRFLRDILSAVRAMGLLWGSSLRSILFFVLPAKHPLPKQTSYFRPRQSGIIPIRGVALLDGDQKFCRIAACDG